MGQRGPAPTPTPLLRLRGSTLVTQKREQREVKGPQGKPSCPNWIDDEAKDAWKQIVPLLEQMEVLTRIDRNALSRYCQLWARWKKAEQFIQKHGDTYQLKDDSGKTKCLMQFPQVSIAHKLAAQLTKLEAEFGMTPSARSRIQLMDSSKLGDPYDAKARFFEAG